MRTVLLASLRVHARRYLAAVVAIVVATGFVVVTDALGSATSDGLAKGVALPLTGATEVVTGLDGGQAVRLVDRAERDGHPAGVQSFTSAPVRADGAPVTEVSIGGVATEPEGRWQTLVDGRYPRGEGEALVDANAAKAGQVGLGDTITLGRGNDAREVAVVGLADSPGGGVGSQVYLTWPDQRAFLADAYVDAVSFVDPPADLAAQVAALSAPDASVVSAQEHVRQLQQDAARGVDVIAILLLLFAAVCAVVAVIVIANTFAILFAQRQREVALLRCVGATRRQVRRSVRLEALVLGVAASLLGLVAGAAAGHAVVAAIRALFPAAGMGDVSLSVPWLLGAFALGTLVTLLACWLPTRSVTRVDPLAALRPTVPGGEGAALPRARVALGVVVTAVGAAGLALAVSAQDVILMLAGGAATAAGVLALGPLLVPAVLRVVGQVPARWGGPAGRLAVDNATRNPRRTATTAASLLVGVTLTTAVLTGTATARGSVDQEMATDHPVDAALTSTSAPVGGDLLARVAGTPGVSRAVAVTGARAEVGDVGALTLLAPTAADRDRVARSTGAGDALALPPGSIALPPTGGVVPETVTVRVGDRTERLRAAVVAEGWGEDAALVAPQTLERLAPRAAPYAVWVRAEAGVDAQDLIGDLGTVAGPADLTLTDGVGRRAWVDLQLDVLVGAVLGLLGVSVAIALVGIANTLGLSVVERGREHALLRALGLTRRQLRRTLSWEALLLTSVAAIVGTAVGLVFAWVGVQTMVRQVVEDTGFVVPWGQLLLVLVVSGLAGVAAGVLPARRAARVAPAEGLALD